MVLTLGSAGKATVKPSFGYAYSLQLCAPTGALAAMAATMKAMRRIFDVLGRGRSSQPLTSYAVARVLSLKWRGRIIALQLQSRIVPLHGAIAALLGCRHIEK